MRRALVVGATSAIAQATARRCAGANDRLYLVARNAEQLQALPADLRTRGARQVESQVMDATDYAKHASMLAQARATLNGLDTVLIAHGTLPDQSSCEAGFDETLQELHVNNLSVISLLTHLANEFELQRHGSLAVISSPAGDRGRQGKRQHVSSGPA